jgi:ligand-binding SRPBCC domain-containing protein
MIMREYELIREQTIDADLDVVFAFFADARNLEELTPPWLNFEIITPDPIDMAVGTRIDYRLRVHGIPVRWQSEITAWEPMRRFVDEQRRGPYQQWIHLHEFEEVDGGTRVRDHVRYAVPGGALVHRLFVARDLEKIWDYRARKLNQLFAVEPATR